MATKTTLKLLLLEAETHVTLGVDSTKVVVKELLGEPRKEWLSHASKELKQLIKMEEVDQYIAKIDVRFDEPYPGARPTIRVGALASFYVNTRLGQKAFWIDTVRGISTEVTM